MFNKIVLEIRHECRGETKKSLEVMGTLRESIQNRKKRRKMFESVFPGLIGKARVSGTYPSLSASKNTERTNVKILVHVYGPLIHNDEWYEGKQKEMVEIIGEWFKEIKSISWSVEIVLHPCKPTKGAYS